MSHANARLTPAGRLRLAQLVVEQGWTLRRAAERWNCSVTTARRWADRYRASRAAPAWSTGPRAAPLPAPHPDAASSGGWSGCGSHAAGGRPGSPTGWAGALDGAQDPAPLRLPAAGVDRPGHRGPDQVAPDADRPTPTSTTRPATWSTSTSRSSAGSPTAAAGASSGRQAGRQATPRQRGIGYCYIHNAVDDHSRLAYSELLTDERKETAAAFWTRANAYFDVRRHHRPAGADRQRLLLPLQALRHRPWARPSHTSGPGPTDPRPTARSSGSTAPCSRSGPTPSPTAPRPNAPRSSPTGSTPTITTAATPHSAASHQPTSCPTCVDRTARSPGPARRRDAGRPRRSR